METSDSDYFESADEEVYTDDDNKHHGRSVKNLSDAMCTATGKLKQLGIAEETAKLYGRPKSEQPGERGRDCKQTREVSRIGTDDDVKRSPRHSPLYERDGASFDATCAATGKLQQVDVSEGTDRLYESDGSGQHGERRRDIKKVRDVSRLDAGDVKKSSKHSPLYSRDGASYDTQTQSIKTEEMLQTDLLAGEELSSELQSEEVDKKTFEPQGKIDDIWNNNNWDEVESSVVAKLTAEVNKTQKPQNKPDANMWGDDDDDWNEIATMIKNESKPLAKTPPAKGTCWLPGVINAKPRSAAVGSKDAKTSKESVKKAADFGEPPARTYCWEEGVNTVSSFAKDVSKKSSADSSGDDKSVHRPEFVDVQARSDCWDEGANDNPTADSLTAFGTIGDSKVRPQRQESVETDRWEEGKGGVNIQSLSKNRKRVEQQVKEENMWEDDAWEPLETDFQQAANAAGKNDSKDDNSTWSSWGNWGISSVISTASTLTSHVSQGLSNVIESGIGVPEPEELARVNKLEKEKLRETRPEENKSNTKSGFGLGNLMHGVTKLVETTGNKVITGGLDTLETIGKKTMEVLQENDPGLKKKRAFLKIEDDKPILSQVLREAKEKAEQENKRLEEKHFAKKANYETLFDDHQGLVHLEALEMLSRQCDIKLQNLLEASSGSTLTEIRETMDQVKELCELPDEDEDENVSGDEMKEKLEYAVSELNVNISYKRLLKLWEEVEDWLTNLNLNICNEKELHQQAIETLAQLTAISVEQFHKCGELLLVKDHRSTADEADSLVQLTTTLTALIGIAAAKFSEKLNTIVASGGNKEVINGLITNVFFEAANSSSYIQDAFQLLIPVLQVGAV